MMTTGRLLGWTLILFLAGSAVAETDEDKSWETFLDLKVIRGVLGTFLEEHPLKSYPDEWITLERYAADFSKRFKQRLPLRDGWGRKFLVGAVRGGLIVISLGPNGEREISVPEGELDWEPSPDLVEKALGDDIVLEWESGTVVNGPRTLREKLEGAKTRLRMIGAAMESYAIDHNRYPEQIEGLRPLEVIASELQPVYVRHLPVMDPWGEPLLFWSDGNGYVVLSLGADSLLDEVWKTHRGLPTEVQHRGANEDPSADIVFSDGSFEQWPKVDWRY